MFNRNQTTPAQAALVLCAALFTRVVMAAPPTLQTIAVTPIAASIDVGEKQRYTATGTYSNGTRRVLGPDVSNIALGANVTCALLTGGHAECWGENSHGELGDGSTVDSLIPQQVQGIATATAVTYGKFGTGAHGCALLTTGSVKCWGSNSMGQLGNGIAPPWDSTIPVFVSGMNSATAIAAGGEHSCAVLAGGAIQCWGGNAEGELGDGTNANSNVPVGVAGISTATAVATGLTHSCALLASGAVQCWGLNYFGQLGNGTTTDSRTPVTVVGIDRAAAIAVGTQFSCALLTSGAVQCWGHGGEGELGDGRSEPYLDHSSTPVSVALPATAVAITAGTYHACALMSNGTARCWGQNIYGQLGTGFTTADASNTPVRINGIGAAVRLAAGLWHTCALLADGAMRCWGVNISGELGNRRRRVDGEPTRWPVNVIGTPGVVWKSSDPAKATISWRGLATGRAAGNTTITATTAGFINDNAVLTVK